MCENDCGKSIYINNVFFCIIEVITCENDCVKSVYKTNAFLPYYYILIILKSIFKSKKTKKQLRI